jgi:predicted Zn-dependent peptidase
MADRRSMTRRIAAAVLVLALSSSAHAQDLSSFERQITVHVLSNGLTLIVRNRPGAPVFAYHAVVDVGSADDPPGQTGLAHMFEHLAFLGTDRLGTTDIEKERPALARAERAFERYRAGRATPQAGALRDAWRRAIQEADRYVVGGAFAQQIERAGGVGVQALTSVDETSYFYSLPSNRLELWAFLESERFLHPVLRRFYQERAVVREERRMRVENRPVGQLLERFHATAFRVHPYRQAPIGSAEDLRDLSATAARAFHARHYVPGNVTLALVGDVPPRVAIRIVERYFGRWKAGVKPPRIAVQEPPQRGERRVIVEAHSRPFYIEAYPRPPCSHPDDAVYAVLEGILWGNSDIARLGGLVPSGIAEDVGGINGRPGSKYSSLFGLHATPAAGKSLDEVVRALRLELQRLLTEPVPEAEIAIVRRRARAFLLTALGTDEGTAKLLAETHARRGDWRDAFWQVDRLGRVTPADVQRVARATFQDRRRTLGLIVPKRTNGGQR